MGLVYQRLFLLRPVLYNEHRPRRPPLDLPSLLLRGRIVCIGMPLVPAVTELVIAELMYLQRMDPMEPVYKLHWSHS
ncbi:hypothetical protein PVL29_006683 [Vitis rotundifolia]|uniref:Uncharacterized protein n=1 Tax=Vitis rotundifolia TaxID=103349 RepID=A0AA39DZ72_VITRO|nr:hypothetical protein PVL29_006683 [Vitis rotundifolia]